MKPWHFVVSHLGLACIVALALVAWAGWHRPIPTSIIEKPILQVQPGQERIVPIVVGGQTVPQIVTAPSPSVRVITSPAQPVVVSTPSQRTAVEKQANLVVTFDLTRDCVHPDVQGPPDPTCGKPVDGHIELVQNGGGFVRVASPGQPIETGPITTQVNHVTPPAVHPWGVGVAAMGIADQTGFHGVAGPDVSYTRTFGALTFHAAAIADLRGDGIGGFASLNIQF